MESWDINELDVDRTTRRCSPPTTRAGRSCSSCPPASASASTRSTSAPGSWSSPGAVEISEPGGETVTGGAGLLAIFDPNERHEVAATEDARLLLVLSPWPGEGHPSQAASD